MYYMKTCKIEIKDLSDILIDSYVPFIFSVTLIINYISLAKQCTRN